jgi:pyridoxine 5'-phosphate synthase PdxJ
MALLSDTVELHDGEYALLQDDDTVKLDNGLWALRADVIEADGAVILAEVGFDYA